MSPTEVTISFKRSKDLIKTSIIDGSVHYLQKILLNEKITFKVSLLIIFFIFTVLCFLTINTSVQAYFSYAVVTNVKQNSVTSLVFPAVTICNTNSNLAISDMLLGCLDLLNQVCKSDDFVLTTSYLLNTPGN